MSIQQWHTLVRLEYYKCNFPSAVDDRLQRDIFVIGLNDTFKQFRSDLILRENLASLTFEQVINKARDFEAGLKTESAITKQQLEESVHQLTPSVSNKDTTDAAHKVTPNAIKSRPPRRPFRQRGFPASQSHASPTCLLCGHTPHAARRDCPAANDTCHGCSKRGHWKQVCQASAANTVYQADTGFQSSTAYVITHDIAQVQSAPKGILVDLDRSPTTLQQLAASDFKWTLDAHVTPYTSQIYRKCLPYKLNLPVFVSLTTPNPSSQLEVKPHCTVLAKAKPMMYWFKS